MAERIACMGGWCALRLGCPARRTHVATSALRERLCQRGRDGVPGAELGARLVMARAVEWHRRWAAPLDRAT